MHKTIKIGNMGSDPVGVFFPTGPWICSKCGTKTERATKFSVAEQKSLCSCGGKLTKGGQHGGDR